jgi:hypothetical protein
MTRTLHDMFVSVSSLCLSQSDTVHEVEKIKLQISQGHLTQAQAQSSRSRCSMQKLELHMHAVTWKFKCSHAVVAQRCKPLRI